MGLKIYNIEKGDFETERVCAEKAMRFLYGTLPGGLFAGAFIARPLFSRLCGIWADSKVSARAIEKFAEKNGINLEEAERDISNYSTFNEFFSRSLKPSARPVPKSGLPSVLFPCDGRHLLIRGVTSSDSFYAKGQSFNLKKFLGDEKLARRFEGGDMLISRLSPLDYHRFHFPIHGEICARRLINGKLFSVSPIALVPRLSVLWENKRVLNIIDSKDFGMCVFMEIGATNVGTIVNLKGIGETAAAGECAGFFKLGASCLATIFPAGLKLDWNSRLIEMGSQNIECYARANTLAAISREA